MLRDALSGADRQIEAAAEVIARLSPDILLLTRVDYDAGLAAAKALADRFAAAGAPCPEILALAPNTGLATGFDIDGDGRLGGPADAMAHGDFRGQGGMLLLSRLPIDRDGITELTGLLWRDLPGHLSTDPAPLADVQRLSSGGHWLVPIEWGGTRLTILAYHATTPAFDGPDDRNGRRNHDENALWLRLFEGRLTVPPPGGPVVLVGTANLDPFDGDGRRAAIRALLAHPRLQDPRPASAGARLASARQGGVNRTQTGPPELDTADWNDARGPGNLRSQYILPDRALPVLGAGVFWPVDGTSEAAWIEDLRRGGGFHGLVWVDLGAPRD